MTALSTPILQTDRLVLREVRVTDFAPFHAMAQDREHVEFINSGQCETPTQTWNGMAAVIGHWVLRGYGEWTVELKATGTPIGRVGMVNPEGWPSPELGWMLGRPYWHQGFATEAARAAMDFAFEQIGLDRVVSLIHPMNQRSLRLAERLGEQRGPSLEVGGIERVEYSIERDGWALSKI